MNQQNINFLQKSKNMSFSEKVEHFKHDLNEFMKEIDDSDKSNYISNSFFRTDSNLKNIKYSDI